MFKLFLQTEIAAWLASISVEVNTTSLCDRSFCKFPVDYDSIVHILNPSTISELSLSSYLKCG